MRASGFQNRRRRYNLTSAMDIAPIKGKRDYRRAVTDIKSLMTAERDTPEGDRLNVLVILVEAWEHTHFPLEHPDT
jgi:HTH-type transcriptional regulator/antitoxin HigA